MLEIKINPGSIREITQLEINYVVGGLDNKKIILGALSGATVKTLSYYIGALLPHGEKDKFLGEVWNGFVRGLSSFLATIALGIAGTYIVTAIRKHPNPD